MKTINKQEIKKKLVKFHNKLFYIDWHKLIYIPLLNSFFNFQI